mgnify:CR=1 FL=1
MEKEREGERKIAKRGRFKRPIKREQFDPEVAGADPQTSFLDVIPEARGT